ncbi:3-alpha-hydroxysteroid dehydrogenase [Actinosynnema sp. ALI-1.44]|uniref:glucose 1-dehydrogenase n=1 Tax=Actinosynnema sp. ALI-1.44 TaxID=1933779 RepID=UPI00097C0559|nr:glucose 1-dehydrogenase [Actinosynnema sp. ALI-1.44]ONI70759.1 3-alpha-hydroxysteroid dehydrogenase [Actinosynnema sp. ALI-1.44]
MGRLAGKTALITGAARGQGAAAARRFVAEGARVAIADILDDQGKELAAELGEHAVYHHLDVTSEGDWAAAVERTLVEFGTLNVLVNNAGILHLRSIVDTTVADYERVIKVNQFGTFLGMRAVIPALTDAKGGSIINVSSVEGLGGMAFLIAYTASKFAVRGMTKAAAVELGHLNIRVNSIHPGVIDTQMVREAVEGVEVDVSRVGKRVPLRRCGQPEEIADLQVFLASDESSYSTGAEFVADGGATATHSLL